MKRITARIACFVVTGICGLALYGCNNLFGGDDDNGQVGGIDTPNDTVVVDSPADLMSALDIPGATAQAGDIPVPAGSPGTTLALDTEEIVVTANSEHQLRYSVSGGADDPAAMYIQFEGVDSHFVVNLSEVSASQAVAKAIEAYDIGPASTLPPGITGVRPIRGLPGLQPSGVYESTPLEVSTTVRTYSAPLQAGIPDFSFITDPDRWSNPVTVTTRVVNVGSGTFQVSLTWNTTADLDLWLNQPDESRIWYQAPISRASGGQLDVDDVDGYGPENIFFDGAPSLTGPYTIVVSHFSGASPTNYTVRVTINGSTETHSGTVTMFNEVLIDTVTVE